MKKFISTLLSASMVISMFTGVAAEEMPTITVEDTAFTNTNANWRVSFFDSQSRGALPQNENGVYLYAKSWVTLTGTAAETGIYKVSLDVNNYGTSTAEDIELCVTGGGYVTSTYEGASDMGYVYLKEGYFEVRIKNIGTGSLSKFYLDKVNFTKVDDAPTAEMKYMVDGRKNNEGNYIEGWSHYLPVKLAAGAATTVSFNFHSVDSGQYTIKPQYAIVSGTQTISVAIDGESVGEATLDPTFDFYTHKYTDAITFDLNEGDHVVSITAASPSSDIWLESVMIAPWAEATPVPEYVPPTLDGSLELDATEYDTNNTDNWFSEHGGGGLNHIAYGVEMTRTEWRIYEVDVKEAGVYSVGVKLGHNGNIEGTESYIALSANGYIAQKNALECADMGYLYLNEGVNEIKLKNCGDGYFSVRTISLVKSDTATEADVNAGAIVELKNHNTAEDGYYDSYFNSRGPNTALHQVKTGLEMVKNDWVKNTVNIKRAGAYRIIPTFYSKNVETVPIIFTTDNIGYSDGIVSERSDLGYLYLKEGDNDIFFKNGGSDGTEYFIANGYTLEEVKEYEVDEVSYYIRGDRTTATEGNTEVDKSSGRWLSILRYDSSLTYSIDIQDEGYYEIILNTSQNQPAPVYPIIDGDPNESVRINNGTSDMYNFQDTSMGTFYLTEGEHTLTFTGGGDNEGYSIGTLRLTGVYVKPIPSEQLLAYDLIRCENGTEVYNFLKEYEEVLGINLDEMLSSAFYPIPALFELTKTTFENNDAIVAGLKALIETQKVDPAYGLYTSFGEVANAFDGAACYVDIKDDRIPDDLYAVAAIYRDNRLVNVKIEYTMDGAVSFYYMDDFIPQEGDTFKLIYLWNFDELRPYIY